MGETQFLYWNSQKSLFVLLQKLETPGPQMHDEEAFKVEKQVVQHFNQIHGLLICEEEEILKKIRNAQNQTHSSLSNIVNELEVNIKVNKCIFVNHLCTR